MTVIHHATFGQIGGKASEDGAIFNPMVWLACPGNEQRARAWFRRKAARFVYPKTGRGLVDGLRGGKLASRLDDAADMGMWVFMTRDYARAGITEDEVGKAILQAGAYCVRAQWRDGHGHRCDVRNRYPYMGSMHRTGDNPATIALAVERAERGMMMPADDAREALAGAGREEKIATDTATAVYMVEGGRGQGQSDGKMVPTVTRKTWVETPHGEYRFSCRHLHGGWRMERGRARPVDYAPCVVPDVVDCDDAPRFTRVYVVLAAGMPATDGDGTGRNVGAVYGPAHGGWRRID